MIFLTTESPGILFPFAWVLGKIFNGLFELIFLIAGWFTEHTWVVPIVAIGIVLFTIVIRMIMLPLTIKQQKFSKLQNMMNPEIQEIQAKYRDKKDQASMMKLNEETKEVYAKYGASPSGGCLTMIIQLPIMFALYRVIYKIPGYVAKIKIISAVLAIASVSTLSSGTAATDDFKKLYTSNKEIVQTVKENDTTTYKVEVSMDGLDEKSLNQTIDIVYNFGSKEWKTANDVIGDLNVADFMTDNNVEAKLLELGYSEAQIANLKKTIKAADGGQGTKMSDLSSVIQGYNSLFGMNMMERPWDILTDVKNRGYKALWIILIPLLAGAAQFASSMLMQSKNKTIVGQNQTQTQESMQKSMKMLNYVMPLMSVFFCFTFPACIGIYWIASSVVQMVVQLIINHQMDNMDIEEMVQKNIDKENAKRAKKGLPPKKYVNSASTYAEQVKKQEARDARRGEREAEMRKSTEYYSNGNTAKPGSLAAKANMVKMFNERNNVDNNNKQ